MLQRVVPLRKHLRTLDESGQTVFLDIHLGAGTKKKIRMTEDPTSPDSVLFWAHAQRMAETGPSKMVEVAEEVKVPTAEPNAEEAHARQQVEEELRKWKVAHRQLYAACVNEIYRRGSGPAPASPKW